jgi:hypothetical protein
LYQFANTMTIPEKKSGFRIIQPRIRIPLDAAQVKRPSNACEIASGE